VKLSLPTHIDRLVAADRIRDADLIRNARKIGLRRKRVRDVVIIERRMNP
jgi:hypothetical protein